MGEEEKKEKEEAQLVEGCGSWVMQFRGACVLGEGTKMVGGLTGTLRYLLWVLWAH